MTLAVALVSSLLASSKVRPARAQAAERPNVLLILTDDQPLYPNLERVMPETTRIFGQEGTTYSNAVVTTPLCCPSRASIFSGRYVHNHGVNVNDATDLDMTATMQHQLSKKGYQTALAGKFFNSWSENPPDFDRWAVHIRPARKAFYGAPFNLDGYVEELETYATSEVERKAIEFLDYFEVTDDDPWFMQVSPYAPHKPATPELKYRRAPVPWWKQTPAHEELDLMDKPQYVRDLAVEESYVRALRRKQLRSLMSVDDMVAEIFAELEELGEADNTIAFFLSDNGYMMYEHGLEGKRVAYNESVRIPFYARWPGHLGEGVVDPRIVANIDIAPTVYEATGTHPNYVFDGEPIWSSDRQHILMEHLDENNPQVPAWRALWAPTWEYIENGDGSREYYGQSDPYQLTNLYGNKTIGDEPLDGDMLSALLQTYAECAGTIACP